MPQFFVNEELEPDGSFKIKGDDFYHLTRVRRIRPDDIIKIRYNQMLHEASIVSVESDYIVAKLGELVSGLNREPDVTLICAILKSGNFDFVIQKAVETGASRIIPVKTERTITDISDKKKSKLERWKKISIEASKQSLRQSAPEICDPMEFKEAVDAENYGLKIIAHPGTELNIKDLLSSQENNIPVTLFIGPEGGFTEKELDYARARGFTEVNFGFSHLRAETAVIVFLSIIIYEMSGI